MENKLLCTTWLWTYKDPKTGQWIEDNNRYMTVDEANDYFGSIDKKIEFKIFRYAPKNVLVPIVDGVAQWLKAEAIEPESRPAPKTN